jgi:hypothetical protein
VTSVCPRRLALNAPWRAELRNTARRVWHGRSRALIPRQHRPFTRFRGISAARGAPAVALLAKQGTGRPGTAKGPRCAERSNRRALFVHLLRPGRVTSGRFRPSRVKPRLDLKSLVSQRFPRLAPHRIPDTASEFESPPLRLDFVKDSNALSITVHVSCTSLNTPSPQDRVNHRSRCTSAKAGV